MFKNRPEETEVFNALYSTDDRRLVFFFLPFDHIGPTQRATWRERNERIAELWRHAFGMKKHRGITKLNEALALNSLAVLFLPLCHGLGIMFYLLQQEQLVFSKCSRENACTENPTHCALRLGALFVEDWHHACSVSH